MSTEPWMKLKEQGNTHFKAKQYELARQAYQQAITELKSNSSGSTPTPANESTQLAILESNLSATFFQLGNFSGSIAAADRAIGYDSMFLKAHLRKAHALERLATMDESNNRTEAAIKLKVDRLQEAATIVQKIRQLMMNSSASNVTPSTSASVGSSIPAATSTSQPSLNEVNTTFERLRTTLSNLRSDLSSPLAYITALRNGESATPASDIRQLMQLIVASGNARQSAYEAGLIPLLLQLVLTDSAAPSTTYRVRTAAARALRHILGTDISNSSSTSVALDLEPIRAAVPSLLSLLDSLQTIQVSQRTQIPPPLPTTAASLASFLSALISVLARLAVHPKLKYSVTETITTAFTKLIPRYSTQSSLPDSAWSANLIRVIVSAIDGISFISSAPLPAALLTSVRHEWLPILLLEPIAEVAHQGRLVGSHHLRNSLLACLAVITKTAHSRTPNSTNSAALNSLSPLLKKTFGQTTSRDDSEPLTEAQTAALEEEGRQIREESLRLFYHPLITGVLSTPLSSSTQLTYQTTVHLIRGLSLLIQSNTLLGTYVITFGETKDPQPTPTSTDSHQEERKMKEEADTHAKKPSNTKQPTPSKPTVLQLLLSLSNYVTPSTTLLPRSTASDSHAHATKFLQLLSAEILALASTDSFIRQTIIDLSKMIEPVDEELIAEGVQLPPGTIHGKGAHVFLDLIIEYTERPTADSATATNANNSSIINPNEMIVAHAILALSKLIAVGEWGTTSTVDDSTNPTSATISDESSPEFAVLLHILTRMVDKYEGDIPHFGQKEEKDEAKKLKKSVKSLTEDDDEDEDDDSAELLIESTKFQHVSLLHLCFESLNYLSLHAFSKRWLVLDSNSHVLKMLIRVASGHPPPSKTASTPAGSSSPIRDVTLRYALLHLFQNLVTSRETLIATAASQSNAEVDALKSVASRGLNKTGTTASAIEEQNERMKEMAGSSEFIHELSQVLVKERLVKGVSELWKGYVLQQQEDEERGLNKKQTSSSSTSSSTSTTTSSRISPALLNSFAFILLQLASHRELRGALVQQGAVRLLIDLYHASAKPRSPSLPPVAIERGDISLTAANSPFRCSQDCLYSLARILISLNPTLLTDSLLTSSALALLEGLEVSEHELMTFEILMALTNLASFKQSDGTNEQDGLDLAELICTGSKKVEVKKTDRVRTTTAAGTTIPDPDATITVQLNGWNLAKSQLVCSNPLVQRAAIELMTNLVNTHYVRTRLRGVPAELDMMNSNKKVTEAEHAASLAATWATLENGTATAQEDIRLLLVFALSDDHATQLAATGALAMISADPLIAQRIGLMKVMSYVPVTTSDEETQPMMHTSTQLVQDVMSQSYPAPAGMRTLIRTGFTIVDTLIRDSTSSPDIRVRVDVLNKNLVASTQQRPKKLTAST